MSSDGASEKPRSARPGRSDDTGGVQVAMAILLVLAVVATVVMVFSDNPMWMRIGTLAALWAAFIGAFLVGRYKRQAASEAARVRDLATVYELQLEREISARREHELVVEKDLRDKVQAETSESVTALRQEIAALREQLAQLTGQPLPEDRFAVGHDAPAAALTAGTGQSTRTSVPSERVEPRRGTSGGAAPSRAFGSRDPERAGAGSATGTAGVAGATAGAGAGGAAGAALGGVGRDSTPSTESTGRIRPVTDDTRDEAPTRAPGRGPAVRPSTPGGREHVFTSDRGETPTSGSGSTARGWGSESRRPAHDRPEGESGGVSAGRPSESATPSRTGRQPIAEPQPVRPQSAEPRPATRQQPEPQQPTAQTTPIAREGGHARPETAQPLVGGGHARPEQPVEQPQPLHEPAHEQQHSGGHQQLADQQPAPEKSAEQQAAEEHAARHAKGSSVAELMARLGAEAPPTGGGRRRRRSED